MPAITFTYASLGAYTGGFSSVRVPRRTTGQTSKRMSELLRTTGFKLPKCSSNMPVTAVPNSLIVWSNLFSKNIDITGMLPAKVGRTSKQISETSSYTGSTIPRFGTYKRVSIYGMYMTLLIKQTTSFGPLPKIGSNRIPFSSVPKSTGVKTMYMGNANAKIKLWGAAAVTGSQEPTSQANIQFWS